MSDFYLKPKFFSLLKGYTKKQFVTDLTAGIILHAKVGDYVGIGDRLATLYSNNKEKLTEAASIYKSAVVLGAAPQKQPLIYKVIK